jgi:FtsH-binding integral membrane protein
MHFLPKGPPSLPNLAVAITERRQTVPNHTNVAFHRVAAYLAAPLWAMQAVIWIVAPKVQQQTPPYQITNAALFVLFWLSIAGAVAFSAAAAGAVPRLTGAKPSRLLRAGSVLNAVTLGLTALATIAIAVAPLAKIQALALTVITNALYAATFTLAATLTIYAITGRRAEGSMTRLPSALAALTILTIVAILASSTASSVGLYFAVVIVVTDGIAWFLLGHHDSAAADHPLREASSSTTRRSR